MAVKKPNVDPAHEETEKILSDCEKRIKKEYEIPPPPELQYLELSTWREADRNRTEHKVMDYHAITI